MPGVTIKGVSQQDFISALAAFLKNPGSFNSCCVGSVKLVMHKELVTTQHLYFYGGCMALSLEDFRDMPNHLFCCCCCQIFLTETT